jgi:hypothetical protein
MCDRCEMRLSLIQILQKDLKGMDDRYVAVAHSKDTEAQQTLIEDISGIAVGAAMLVAHLQRELPSEMLAYFCARMREQEEDDDRVGEIFADE